MTSFEPSTLFFGSTFALELIEAGVGLRRFLSFVFIWRFKWINVITLAVFKLHAFHAKPVNLWDALSLVLCAHNEMISFLFMELVWFNSVWLYVSSESMMWTPHFSLTEMWTRGQSCLANLLTLQHPQIRTCCELTVFFSYAYKQNTFQLGWAATLQHFCWVRIPYKGLLVLSRIASV